MRKWITARYKFLASETAQGETAHTDQRCVELSCQLETWAEHHPYGATTAAQEMSDILDTGYTLRLDGDEISREELEGLFGKEWVDATIKHMEEVAE